MNRRTMLKVTGTGTVGVLAFGAAGCDKKDVSFYVSVFSGAMEELIPLLPGQRTLLERALSAIKTFKSAYDAGKFDNAVTALENASTVLGEIIGQVGNVSDAVKVAITVAGVGLRAIAALLKAQTADPAVQAEMNARAGTPAARHTLSVIERLANAAALDRAYQASKP